MGRPSFVAELGLWDDRQLAAAEEVEASLGEVDLVRLAFCDPHGLARSKTLTASAFRSVLRNGMDFSPGPFIFDTGHAIAVDFIDSPGIGVDEIIGAGDFAVVPDPVTFQLIPGSEPRTAWVLGDEFTRDGAPHPLSTRHVLRRVCAEYAARDLTPVVGLEVEWYLTRRLGGPPGHVGNGFGTQGAAPEVEPMNAGYQFNLDSYYDSVAAVANPLAVMLLALGLPLRSIEHESGPGQLETTFDPMSAMDTADAMLLFRTMVKQACARRGYHASFMSLPRIDGFDPNGWHLHQSVMDGKTGRNLFAVDGSDELSADGKAYIEGLLARARDLCLLSVPTVNGYRRLSPDFALSPTRIGWSFEDRTAMIRVLGGGSSTHAENRVGEPCANPYLAIAGQLFAGLDGLTGDPNRLGAEREAGPQTVPQSLGESLEAFRTGPAERLLGAPLATCLTKLKESELSRFEDWCATKRPRAGQVTEWEQREYFENF
ncbi:MAG TPA: glutamine synthetase family protein [Actinophytocola sp.]|uniref:glutamine synthetase family protein n=1 Tax=Actinophytocola sp. TaxID=1872138 RepID=UPI002DDD50B2|nr:glutamine synthetase family protein [Actinophytocola sp.]HEV2780537.1 glutamine synthetase family protein [Actinophytocola sp.]